ncbi:HNH endonuclease [uncultured Methanobrevibacter sp.]|uniref:HNH endonuclease n=1 Tax=uncultured Methanobrevibacter sp. TaxID=253161 RepID=UPI003207D4A5
MEKYCKSCGRVFDDLNYKLCPFCGGELDTRYGRQPIPRKLRHEVFKRDGYRCRECGASKDETSLEIDHIVPVAKGGTNDIDNLQTLCRECNRMKHTDEWVGGESDIESTKNELKLLKEQLIKLENALDSPTTEEERIDLKYKIIKLNEAIEKVQIRLDKLIIKQKQLEKELEEYRRKKSLFKRLYVELTDEELDLISFHLLLAYSSKEKYAIKEELVRYLVNHYSHSEILDLIDKEREISRSQEFYYINRYRIEIIYCAYSQYKNFGISFFKIDWENQTISFPWNEETQTLTFNEIYDDLGILEDPLPHLTFLDKILLKEEWDYKFNNDFSNKQIDPLTFEEFGFFYNHYRYSKFNSRFESSDIGFLDYETLKRSYDENELITIYDYDIEDKKDIFCIEIRSKELYYLIKFNIDWEAIKREEEERKKGKKKIVKERKL